MWSYNPLGDNSPTLLSYESKLTKMKFGSLLLKMSSVCSLVKAAENHISYSSSSQLLDSKCGRPCDLVLILYIFSICLSFQLIVSILIILMISLPMPPRIICNLITFSVNSSLGAFWTFMYYILIGQSTRYFTPDKSRILFSHIYTYTQTQTLCFSQ